MRHRTTKSDPRVDVAICRAWNLVEISQPVVRIELTRSSEGIERAVVLRSARLRYRSYHHRTIRLVYTKIRGLDLYLRDHSVIDVLKVGAEVACVREIGAIQLQRDACDWRTVRGVGRFLTDLYIGEVWGRVACSQSANRKSRKCFFQLGRISSHNR